MDEPDEANLPDGSPSPTIHTGSRRVVVRQPPAMWLLVGLTALPPAILLALPWKSEQETPHTWALLALLTAAFTALPAGIALWLLRWKVLADDHGLRWRTFGRRKQVAWSGVRDYYHSRRQPGVQSIGPAVVDTDDGALTVPDGAASQADFLRIVQERASGARVCSWGSRGQRGISEFPIVFRYAPGDAWAVRIMPFLATASATLILWDRLQTMGERIHDAGLAGLLQCTDTLVMLALMICIVATVVQFARAQGARVGETITLTDEGILKSTRGRECRIARHEIREFTFVRSPRTLFEFGPYRVRGASETIHLHIGIQEFRLLCDLIDQQLPPAVRLVRPDLETLPARREPAVAAGVRVYDCRQRTTRALGWMVSATLLMPSFTLGISLAGLIPPNPFMAAISGPCAVLCVLVWLGYCRFRVEVDPDGIRVVGLFHTSCLQWSHIDYGEVRKSHDLTIVTLWSSGRRVSFWTGMTAGTELLRTLKARVANFRMIGLTTSEMAELTNPSTSGATSSTETPAPPQQ